MGYYRRIVESMESISDHIHSKVHVILPVPDLDEPGYPHHVGVTMLMQKGVNGYPVSVATVEGPMG
jgi:hypothetical protein